MKTLREQIESGCIHFNGIQNKTCKAGISYDSMKPPLPCLRNVSHGLAIPECPKREWPSEEQIEKELAESEARSNRFMLLTPLLAKIRKDHKGESWRGIEVCPVCKGKIHISITAYNGHTRGQCETKDCLAWIE